MTTKPGDVDEEYMWNGYSQTTLAAICDAAEKYIGQYTEEHPYLAFEGNGLAKAILSALPAKPEQPIDTSKPQHLWNEATIKHVAATQEVETRISKMMNSPKPEQAGVDNMEMHGILTTRDEKGNLIQKRIEYADMLREVDSRERIKTTIFNVIAMSPVGPSTLPSERNALSDDIIKAMKPYLRSPTPTEEPRLAYARKYGAFEASGFTVNLKCPEGCTYAIYDDRERGGRWHVIHSNPTPLGDMQAVRAIWEGYNRAIIEYINSARYSQARGLAGAMMADYEKQMNDILDGVTPAWPPIESAPKRAGLHLLGYNAKWIAPQIIYCCVAVNYPEAPAIWSTYGNTWSELGQSTHWYPLPNPPLDGMKAEGKI